MAKIFCTCPKTVFGKMTNAVLTRNVNVRRDGDAAAIRVCHVFRCVGNKSTREIQIEQIVKTRLEHSSRTCAIYAPWIVAKIYIIRVYMYVCVCVQCTRNKHFPNTRESFAKIIWIFLKALSLKKHMIPSLQLVCSVKTITAVFNLLTLLRRIFFWFYILTFERIDSLGHTVGK